MTNAASISIAPATKTAGKTQVQLTIGDQTVVVNAASFQRVFQAAQNAQIDETWNTSFPAVVEPSAA